jgi:hypothetical protein
MRTQLRNRSSGDTGKLLATGVLVALLAAGTPHSAEAVGAGSAGNSIVRNTITVSYNDALGNSQTAVTATIDISVTTVAATPTVLSFTPLVPAASPGSTDGTGATQSYAVRVRTNSNGPNSISFATSDGSFSNVAAGTAPSVPGNIYLGSTIFDPSNFPALGAQNIPVNGALTVAVPNDAGKANDAGAPHTLPDSTVINGIAVNDTVWITDGAVFYGPCLVTAISDPVVGTGSTATPGSITLKNSSAAPLVFTPAYGWQIVESQDVTLTVTQGQVPVASANIAASWVTTVSATMAGAAAGSGTVTTYAHTGRLKVDKYVRNVTQPAMTGNNPFSGNPLGINSGSFSYYQNGITGNPGDILEYLAVLTDDGLGNSTAVLATDAVPTYTTLVTFPVSYGIAPGSSTPNIFAHAKFNAIEKDLKTDNSVGDINAAYGKTTVSGSVTTMTFYLGSNLPPPPPAAGGTFSTGQTAYVIYQVKIN